MISVNKYGYRAFVEMLDNAEELNIEVSELSNGATVVDAGVNAPGGYGAGMYLSRLCLADLADLRFISYQLGDYTVAGIQVATDHPLIACMASQYAGWRLIVGKYFAMGSGPARALSLNPKDLYEEMGYKDSSDKAVIVLETDKLPPEEVADKIATDCGVDTKDLYIAAAPTSSIAGSVQISARIVETGMHKMHDLGFDISSVKHGFGIIPISPIVGDDTKCMGSTNDCIIYGGKTYYTIDYPDIDELTDYVKKVPSETSRDYGKPFYDTFKAAGFDFFKVDGAMFAPAEIIVNELNSKKTIASGTSNPHVLLQSFGMQRV
ncbi:MAG TPA: methenyltetrahydromethanopterin cyclohydrolase [Methanosarcinales archaeon]|nr:methenyltetrahydromethanopterin cyclohydrolase [Methanosarcinales archaeon]